MRVVELCSNIAGPFTTMVLRDLGAEVVKVEQPGTGDTVRDWPPHVAGVSTVFSALNRGKLSVALDTRTPQGLDAMHMLLSTSDVFVESLRPGRAAAMGLSWSALRPINSRLICCGISAFGNVGPLAGQAGFDAIIQAYSGLMDLTGERDGPPVRVGTGVIDFGTGLWAVIGILSALNERISSGSGCQVEATLLGTAVSLMMHHVASITMAGLVPRRAGTAQHNSAPYEAIRAEDQLVMVGVTSQALWNALCDVLGGDELRNDLRFATNVDRVANRIDLVAALSREASQVQAVDLVNRLTEVGVPAATIRSVAELPDDDQVNALSLIQQIADGSRVGVVPIRIDGETPSVEGVTVPGLGSNTWQILESMGMSSEDIRRLVEEGIAEVSA
jgi:crotonobetainyl-CoA:carnitine CoA-transferase CaiB-like acyl-CoA transferase